MRLTRDFENRLVHTQTNRFTFKFLITVVLKGVEVRSQVSGVQVAVDLSLDVLSFWPVHDTS